MRKWQAPFLLDPRPSSKTQIRRFPALKTDRESNCTGIKHYDGFYTALDRALSERKTLRTDALSERYRKLEGFTQLEAMMPTQGMGDYAPRGLAAKARAPRAGSPRRTPGRAGAPGWGGI